MSSLYRIAQRENPKRRFLFVSTVLGKHLPVNGNLALLAGATLGLRLAGDERYPLALEALTTGDVTSAKVLLASLRRQPVGSRFQDPVVVGFAETATSLGHAAADSIAGCRYVHTTRRGLLNERPPLVFTEDHSHAPDQVLYSRGINPDSTVILVDDELTTGNTALNLTRAIHSAHGVRDFHYLTLVDRIDEGHQSRLRQAADELGISIQVTSLQSSADAVLPDDNTPVAGSLPQNVVTDPDAPSPYDVETYSRGAAPVSARQMNDARELDVDYPLMVDALAAKLQGSDIILGCGEHMALAVHVAAVLDLATWSTTRSPVRVSSSLPDYPIRSGIAFDSPEDPSVPGFLYNSHELAGRRVAIFLETRDDLDRAESLILALQSAGPANLTLVVPR